MRNGEKAKINCIVFSSYPDKTASDYSYPEGNFGGNQLLDGLISLSPLTFTVRGCIRSTMVECSSLKVSVADAQ